MAACRRWDVLAALCRDHRLETGAEIGVKAGVNLAHLMRLVPNLTMLAVDPWFNTDGYVEWSDAVVSKHESAFDAVQARYPDRITKLRMTSLEAAEQVADKSLDLVFIDANHTYDAVKADIQVWRPKVRHGGIVAGHDFRNTNKRGDTFDGVELAVREAFGPRFSTAADSVWYAKV